MNLLALFPMGVVGRSVAIALALVAFIAYQRHDAGQAARNECRALELQKELAQISKQRDDAQKLVRQIEMQNAATKTALAAVESKYNDAVATIASDGLCAISDADLRRLRDIK